MNKKYSFTWSLIVLGLIMFITFHSSDAKQSRVFAQSSSCQISGQGTNCILLPLVSSAIPVELACEGLSKKAEDGLTYGSMQIVSDGNVQVLSGDDQVNGDLVTEDRAEYCFTVTKDADYRLEAIVKAPSFGSNSIYWVMEGVLDEGMIWHMNLSNNYSRQTVSDGGSPNGGNSAKTMRLKAGSYTLVLYQREPGVMIE
ncbi:MAG: hypothetical protein AAF902_11745, partial [Chloroflexota bacterium]